MKTRSTFLCLFLVTLARGQGMPSPEEFFGFPMGEDRKLAAWPEIVRYFQALDRESDRLTVEELGKTTAGRPFLVALLTSPENQSRLRELQHIQARLADPRGLSEPEARQLIEKGRTVVLITCNIHSTEVASAQTAVEFAYRMATERTPRVQEILDNVLLLLVPSLNPDGQEWVVDWYRKTLGTPYEGTSPPFLYHKYVGHDNNRDWYMFTQVETRLMVSKLHNAWHPQIVYDVHQMGSNGARIFFPPWIDPIEPNVDPILVQEGSALGTSMAAELTAQGKAGVVVNAIYDAWTPSRAYSHYHGGVRILSESASARLASPVTVKPEQLERGRNYDARTQTWNFPMPWKGGEWHLRDIVEYQLSAFFALLKHASRFRPEWLDHFYRIGRKAVERTEPPYAFVIPAGQRDPSAAARMLQVLHFGRVEVHRARTAFSAGGRMFPAGSHVILLAQPYGAFAQTLLERQRYPDLREYPGGPPRRPYDVTAHTLPLLMGVDALAMEQPFQADLKKVEQWEPPAGALHGNGQFAFQWSATSNNAFTALNRILRQSGRRFSRQGNQFAVGDRRAPWRDEVEKVARELGVEFYASESLPYAAGNSYFKMARIGVYQSYGPSMDEGWTRWVLEQFEFPYSVLHDRDIRGGNLRARFDVVLLPDQPGRSLVEGHRRDSMPPEYTGGLGTEGVHELKAFVEAGGTLVAMDSATELPLEQFGLGLRNVLRDRPPQEFYAPGSILNVRVDTSHPLAFGMPAESIAWFEQSPAFEITDPSVRSVVRYPSEGILASGWLLGGEHLSKRTAVAEAPLGKGRVVLLGFRTQYRGQSHATFKLLLNALYAPSE